MGFTIRPGTQDDVPFLEAMIYEAAFHPRRPRPPLEQALREPRLARWVAGWGRPGDAAAIATDRTTRPVGAAWYRRFPRYEPGNEGFVDPATPVVAIAVVAEWRGQGIGAALLGALVERARATGIAALSLSVGATNPAVRLYGRLGFVRVEGRGATTMTLRVSPIGQGRP